MPRYSQELKEIKNFDQLINYLEEELNWPCKEYGFDEITFKYEPTELGLKDNQIAQIKSIYQLRPFYHGQPWGIFFIEFEKKKLPIVLLRKILNHLVLKKRASASSAEKATWNTDNLLFIASLGEETSDQREIAFAHFHKENDELPTLRVLGWDGADTPLKIDYVSQVLNEKLCWPVDTDDVDTWQEQWSSAFRNKPGHVIRTADALADRLAEMARSIRDAAETLMVHEAENGQLRQLHKAFQTALIHDLTETDFADTYAQTITYGLLTAAISRTDMTAGQYGTALVAENVSDMVPITNPFLRDMLQTFLKVGGQKGGINFDELGIQDVVELLRGKETDLPEILRDFNNQAPGEDPVIHFYEKFLTSYNKKLKIQRGVFYTPKPVVSFIVRSVHELLQTEFGLEDGLADITTWGEMEKRSPGLKRPASAPEKSPFVMILDPAVGTATFLVEVIEIIYHTLQSKWENQGLSDQQIIKSWNEYVPKHLMPRLHGYELMMAPYAIAHMKIPLKLQETGFTNWSKLNDKDRICIYLTNSLEEPSQLKDKYAANLFDALGHEAKAVNDVKRNCNFTVLIGNPPYAGVSSNMSSSAQKLIEPYKLVDGKKLNEKKIWLHDDYVKFFRFAQNKIENSNLGVLGYITNHGYIDNPTFRGMRQNLIKTFQKIRILNLHGNVNKKEQSPDGSVDDNVFDIKQGVAIFIAIKKETLPELCYSELWGQREDKYEWLKSHDLIDPTFEVIDADPPFYLLKPQNHDLQSEFHSGIKINDVFPQSVTGIVTARDGFVIDTDISILLERIKDFRNSEISNEKIRKKYFSGSRSSKYLMGDTRGWKLDKSREKVMSDNSWEKRIIPITYRPFDNRYIYYVEWMVDWPRKKFMEHMLSRSNIGLIWTRPMSPNYEFSVFVSRYIIDQCSVGNKSAGAGISYLGPLYLSNPSTENNNGLFADIESSGHKNLSTQFITSIAKILNLKFVEDKNCDFEITINPENILNYTYAVFYSPTYRNRYAEFLKNDFPYLPLTSNLLLFHTLCNIGNQLVALHLLDAPILDKSIIKFETHGNFIIASGYPNYIDNRVLINPEQSFEGVSRDIWEFQIGGYQVCHKWLKDRQGKQLSGEDIIHYQKIVVALQETIRLMGEIDQEIESAGGWPIK